MIARCGYVRLGAAVPEVRAAAVGDNVRSMLALARQAGAAEVEGEAKAATSTFDKLVAEARTLLADKKYQDALAKLQAGLQMPALDEGQKSTLEKLIEQAKAALKTGVAKDVQDKAADLLKGVGGK